MTRTERLVIAANVMNSPDDEDDEEDEDAEGASKGEGEAEGEEGADKVKPDPDGPAKKPTQELHEYTPDELAPLKKAALVADVELLDGEIVT